MIFYGGVQGDTRNKLLDFDSDQISMLTVQSKIRPVLNKL